MTDQNKKLLSPEEQEQLTTLLKKKFPRVRIGTPLKLTQEVIEQVAKPLSAGCHMETAAAFAGVSRNIFLIWMKKARSIQVALENGKRTEESLSEEDYLFLDFLGVVEKTRANATIRKELRIEKAGDSGIWTADAWWLERSYPGLYGRREESGPSPSLNVNVGFKQISIQPQRPKREIGSGDGSNENGEIIDAEAKVL